MPDQTVIHNERSKLLANALDRASTACLAVGVFGPIAAAYYGPLGSTPVWVVMVGVASWGSAALFLHVEGRGALRSLER
jgi:hypothetical protein